MNKAEREGQKALTGCRANLATYHMLTGYVSGNHETDRLLRMFGVA